MAVVPYYDQTKVKADLRVTDTANDTQLDHWGEEAENQIDDLLYSTASKMRRLASLPTLPFASGSVPESIHFMHAVLPMKRQDQRADHIIESGAKSAAGDYAYI